METKHISHLILYSKNFYAHSEDIVADLQQMCKLDNPKCNVKTKDKLYKVVFDGYKKFYDSWEHENKPELHSRVAWEDDTILAELWSILSTLSVYIPISNKYLDYPIYDKTKNENAGKPQYRLKEELFSKSMSMKQCEEVAKEYIDRSLVDRLDILANEILDHFEFDIVADNFKALGEIVNKEQLDDEFWTVYSDTVNFHINKGVSSVLSKVVPSEHFLTWINMSESDTSIDLHAVYYKKKIKLIPNISPLASIKSCFDFTEFLNRVYRLEDILEIDEKRLSFLTNKESLFELFNELISIGGGMTGGFYLTLRTEGYVEIYFLSNFSCAVFEKQLYNKDLFCSGEKL